MAMLAEPRRRQRYSLNPRGTLWAEDDSKFGQKLMEKMGWSKGKGLGKDEQGDRVPISVRIKDNNKGLGYKGKDDEWVKHYEGFEEVLATLNSENNSRAGSPCSDARNSNVNPDSEDSKAKSLEALSKKSRARVHYHKFTRGKDLSQRNLDDIECITGSKRAKQLAEIAKKQERYEEVEVGKQEHENGVTTIKGGNIQDYFANKMAKLKSSIGSRANGLCPEVCTTLNDELESDQIHEELKPKTRKNEEVVWEANEKFISEYDEPKKHDNGKEGKDVADIFEDDEKLITDWNETKKSKKKSKKEKVVAESCKDNGNLISEFDETSKGKKKIRKEKGDAMNCEDNGNLVSECEVTKKHKKEKDVAESCKDNGNQILECDVTRKSKKKSKKEKGVAKSCFDNGNLVSECEETKKSKKEKDVAESWEDNGNQISECDETRKRKKKSKKEKDVAESCKDIGNLVSECDEIKINKKKRKNENVFDDISLGNAENVTDCGETKKKKNKKRIKENILDISDTNEKNISDNNNTKKNKRKKEKYVDGNGEEEKLVSEFGGKIKKKKKSKESEKER